MFCRQQGYFVVVETPQFAEGGYGQECEPDHATTGQSFWQDEIYDHLVRTRDDFSAFEIN